MADEETQTVDADLELDGGEAEEAQHDADVFEIEIEGEDGGQSDTTLVQHLREQLRERDRRLAEVNKPAQPVEVGEYPSLESCEYDEDKHREAVSAYYARKAQADRAEAEQRQATAQGEREGQDLEVRHRAKLSALPVSQEEKDQADATVRAMLPINVQAAIAKYADDSGKVTFALYKNPAKLAAIAAEPDPVRQLLAIKDLEGKIKVRRKPSAPEAQSIQTGSAPVANKPDQESAKLFKEAERSGDWTAYLKRQRDLRKQRV